MSGPKSVFDPKPVPVAVAARMARAEGRPNTIGKRGKFRLAAACAALMSDEQVAWWLREVMAGRDPDARRDPVTGEPVPSPGGFVKAPEWKDRRWAAHEFLNRRNGLAPASVIVEENIQVTGRIEHAALAPARVRALDPSVKAELRAALKKALGRGELQAAPNNAPIAVEAVEVQTAGAQATRE